MLKKSKSGIIIAILKEIVIIQRGYFMTYSILIIAIVFSIISLNRRNYWCINNLDVFKFLYSYVNNFNILD